MFHYIRDIEIAGASHTDINSRLRAAVYVGHDYPMYPLPAISCIPEQNTISRVNVISEGSPILIRSVRRISFGITMRPRSSIRLTIPVAFILLFSPITKLFAEYCCRYCLQVQENYAKQS